MSRVDREGLQLLSENNLKKIYQMSDLEIIDVEVTKNFVSFTGNICRLTSLTALIC
jgi:hypothetical protein